MLLLPLVDGEGTVRGPCPCPGTTALCVLPGLGNFFLIIGNNLIMITKYGMDDGVKTAAQDRADPRRPS